MTTFLASPRKLRSMGVIGLNSRNAGYVLTHNKRAFYPRVDDKLVTKQLAIEAGLSVPELYETVEIEHDVDALAGKLETRDDFVIKPTHGSGGNGVLVIAGQFKTRSGGRRYRRANGEIVDQEYIEHHVLNMLSGLYSLGGQRDTALIEARAKIHPIFREVTYLGVPDIRILVFLGYPVMAMVRLPTRDSRGRANLHQGAVGVGIDLATGALGTGVHHNFIVEEHPDTTAPFHDIRLPDWPSLMTLAARSYDIVELGYLGVDIILDPDAGPLVLEMNARPGLAIQIANRAGLRDRLSLIEGIADRPRPPEARAEIAARNFASGG